MSVLIDEIVSIREWRIHELEQLKKLKVTTIYSLNNKVNEQYLRMCIPYIYAHWEGFVVETFRLVIDFINNLKLKKEDVTNQLFAFSQKNVYKTLSGKQNFIQCCNFTDKFTKSFNSPLYIDFSLFSTKSNLYYDQLAEIFSWFNLDSSSCKEYESYINQLVNQRNRIAHGENGIIIEYSNIEKYIEILQILFDNIISLLNKYIENKHYLKAKPD